MTSYLNTQKIPITPIRLNKICNAYSENLKPHVSKFCQHRVVLYKI